MRLIRLAFAALLACPATSSATPTIVAMDGIEITFSSPEVVALDTEGRLWIADDCSSPWRIIDTIAGAVAFDWW
jgi:hypothetical protein